MARKKVKVCATSSADLSFVASCHKTPTGFIFDFPIGAKVTLNKTRHLQIWPVLNQTVIMVT